MSAVLANQPVFLIIVPAPPDAYLRPRGGSATGANPDQGGVRIGDNPFGTFGHRSKTTKSDRLSRPERTATFERADFRM